MLIWLCYKSLWYQHYKSKNYIHFFESLHTVIKFDDNKISKQKFYQHKRPISTKTVDIDKIVVSNKIPFGEKRFKYFVGNKDVKKINFYVHFYQKWLI